MFNIPLNKLTGHSGDEPSTYQWLQMAAPIYLYQFQFLVQPDQRPAQVKLTQCNFTLLTTATWWGRAPTLTDSVSEVFLCPGWTSGTSYHLTFGKCPINQNNLLEHWKLFYFQTALTSTSEDNIKRMAIAKTNININNIKRSHSIIATVQTLVTTGFSHPRLAQTIHAVPRTLRHFC